MLSNQHFYHQLTRKYVILMGNMFNNISIVRKSREDGSELERFKVPIIYAPKEKYMTRLRSDPNLNRQIQVMLPRMSFEIAQISYDVGRKQNSLLRAAKGSTDTRVSSQYMGVPYDINFQLNIYSRTIDDGTHIIEQILPYFNPDYTVSMDFIPELGFLKDVPIILNSVSNSVEHDGNFDAVRYVTWELNFTMKVYYYGPVTTPKIIRKSIANINADPKLQAGYLVRINTSQGNNGTFKIDDIVYQGDRYETATAYGTVVDWRANTGHLTIGGAQGTFKIDRLIRATNTNAVYNLVSFDTSTMKYATITVEPDPPTANVDDDFGYSVSTVEWPLTT